MPSRYANYIRHHYYAGVHQGSIKTQGTSDTGSFGPPASTLNLRGGSGVREFFY